MIIVGFYGISPRTDIHNYNRDLIYVSKNDFDFSLNMWDIVYPAMAQYCIQRRFNVFLNYCDIDKNFLKNIADTEQLALIYPDIPLKNDWLIYLYTQYLYEVGENKSINLINWELASKNYEREILFLKKLISGNQKISSYEVKSTDFDIYKILTDNFINVK